MNSLLSQARKRRAALFVLSLLFAVCFQQGQVSSRASRAVVLDDCRFGASILEMVLVKGFPSFDGFEETSSERGIFLSWRTHTGKIRGFFTSGMLAVSDCDSATIDGRRVGLGDRESSVLSLFGKETTSGQIEVTSSDSILVIVMFENGLVSNISVFGH